MAKVKRKASIRDIGEINSREKQREEAPGVKETTEQNISGKTSELLGENDEPSDEESEISNDISINHASYPASQAKIPKPVALVASVVLLICVLLLMYLLVTGMKGAVNRSGQSGPPQEYGNGEDYTSMLPELPNETAPITEKQGAECIAEYKINPQTPIYIYQPTCPYCKEMAPTMMELEKRGYYYSWVDVSLTENKVMLSKC